MKRILILTLFVLVTLCFAGCGDSGDSDDEVSTGTITVKATYTGALEDAAQPGSKKVYVYLYKILSTKAEDASNPDYQFSSETAVTIGVESTIVLEDIEPGDYYVVVFYDYKTHNLNIAGNGDRYVIYDADDSVNFTTQLTAEANAITVEKGSSDTITFSFGNDYLLDSNGAFDTI